MRLTAPLLVLLLLPACTAGVGHPVRLSLPRLPADEWPPPAPGCPEPEPVRGDDARAALMLGLERIYDRVLVMRSRASSGRAPTIARLSASEAAVARRYREQPGPGGRVSQVAVVATAGRVPIPPVQMAALMEDPEVERQVLAARRFERMGVTLDLPGHRRETFQVEKLRVGVGPFRYDLRFAISAERVDLGDGRIVVRYDPAPWERTEGVSLYRGAALIEPDGNGSRVTEVIVFGTPLSVPPPFDGALRKLVYDTFRHRSTNLWKRAWAAGG